nr:histidine phosphatase family protein [Pseudosulfitobacter koreense]
MQDLPARSFCLIRHGETTANADHIIAGRTDVALTAQGRAQAAALAHRIWPDPIALFSSPMSRARDTCALAFPGRDVTLHEGLRERDWGIFEGRSLDAPPARDATPEGGEGWAEMLARVSLTITRICAGSGAALPVLVCHSGIIRAARVLWTSGTVGARPANAVPILFERIGATFKESTL